MLLVVLATTVHVALGKWLSLRPLGGQAPSVDPLRAPGGHAPSTDRNSVSITPAAAEAEDAQVVYPAQQESSSGSPTAALHWLHVVHPQMLFSVLMFLGGLAVSAGVPLIVLLVSLGVATSGGGCSGCNGHQCELQQAASCSKAWGTCWC